MSREMFQVFLGLAAVWGALVGFKAWNAIRTGGEYRFGLWDGGMLRQGKVLTRTGTMIKAGLGAAMAIDAILSFAGMVPFQTGAYLLAALAVCSIVSDLSTTAS